MQRAGGSICPWKFLLFNTLIFIFGKIIGLSNDVFRLFCHFKAVILHRDPSETVVDPDLFGEYEWFTSMRQNDICVPI